MLNFEIIPRRNRLDCDNSHKFSKFGIIFDVNKLFTQYNKLYFFTLKIYAIENGIFVEIFDSI